VTGNETRGKKVIFVSPRRTGGYKLCVGLGRQTSKQTPWITEDSEAVLLARVGIRLKSRPLAPITVFSVSSGGIVDVYIMAGWSLPRLAMALLLWS